MMYVTICWMWGSEEVKSFESEKERDCFLEKNADEIFDYSYTAKENSKIDSIYKKGFGGMSDYEMDMYL